VSSRTAPPLPQEAKFSDIHKEDRKRKYREQGLKEQHAKRARVEDE
jgi:hypothetical protein